MVYESLANLMPPSGGEAVAMSAGRGVQERLNEFKFNIKNHKFVSSLSQYEDDIKDGYFTRISQQAPKLYEALLKAGIAPKEGVDYNNYKISHDVSVFLDKHSTTNTPTENTQNSLTETKMDGYTPPKKTCNQIDVMY